LQALVPLHELMPAHFTEPAVCACEAATKVPAAKMAVAVATRVFLVMFLSRTETASASAEAALHAQTMTRRSVSVKSGLGDGT
jgi:hypothetical protein